MPREKNPIWNYFNCQSKENNSGKWAICKKCNIEMQGIPQRMKKHIENCNQDENNLSTGNNSTEINEGRYLCIDILFINNFLILTELL